MFAFAGLLVVLFLVIGVIGLCFKDNRESEEYVNNVKDIAKVGFDWFVMFPILCFVGLFIAAIVMFSGH